MTFTGTAPVATKTKLNLNKRVAFPMQSSAAVGGSKVQTSAAGLPMPFARVKSQPPPPIMPNAESPVFSPTSLPPPKLPVSATNADTFLKPTPSPPPPADSTTDISSPQVMLEQIQNFAKTLTSLDYTKLEEIQKRLDIINSMWLDNSFDDSLKTKLVKIGNGMRPT